MRGTVLPVEPRDTNSLGLVVVVALLPKYAPTAPSVPPPTVAATVPQLPWSTKSFGDSELAAAVTAAVPKATADPINADAVTVAAADVAAMPLPTIPTAIAAAAKPPHVTTVAIAHAATTAAPIAQCHHAVPLASVRLIGLFPQ